MYTWKHGRQLASMTDGSTTWSYTYNADGLRTSKTDGKTYYSYVYSGDKLTYMTAGNKHMYFAYDANGTPMSIVYSGTVYYYVTNVQGDVIALVDSEGKEVVTYTYDAWGNPLSMDGDLKETLGKDNPLRYRSYVYDQETQLYYLQSRYYNPEIGRFINADTLASTGQGFLGYNMFTYCLNNPVNTFDPNGMCSYSVYYGGEVDDTGCYRCKNKPYINNQEDESVAGKRLGIATISHSGCGPIAVYNAALTLGLKISFDDVCSYYNSNILNMHLLGLAGTPVDMIVGFFEAQGYTVLTTKSTQALDAASPLADACIMYYKFPNTYLGFIDAYGAHFAEYAYMNNGYYAHNVTYGQEFKQPSSFATMNSRYDIVGILIFEPMGA